MNVVEAKKYIANRTAELTTAYMAPVQQIDLIIKELRGKGFNVGCPVSGLPLVGFGIDQDGMARYSAQ